MYITVIK